MTIEEELQTLRPRRRVGRTDGFSDDGLSYSVATDFDKQLGQALAEIEARTADPRFTPGARVENPDAPDLLRQELLDPILTARNAFTGTTPRQGAPKTISPRLFKSGDDVISIDPSSGESRVAYQGAPRQDNTLRNYRLGGIRDQRRALTSLLSDGFKLASSGRTAEDVQAEISALDAQAASLLSPTPIAPEAPTAAAAPRPAPMMAIGEMNQPLSEVGAPVPQREIVKPGQRGGTTPSAKSIDYLMRNPDSAAQFDAKFGRGSAERYLRQ